MHTTCRNSVGPSFVIVPSKGSTLEDVLRWAHAIGGVLVNVIVQDEYTHDVIVRTPRDYVVFDTT